MNPVAGPVITQNCPLLPDSRSCCGYFPPVPPPLTHCQKTGFFTGKVKCEKPLFQNLTDLFADIMPGTLFTQ